MYNREINRLTPEYFFPIVSKKTGVSIEIIRELYGFYLKRVQECTKTENKIFMRGLGTIQLSAGKSLHELYIFGRMLDIHPDILIEGEPQESKYVGVYHYTSDIYQRLLKAKVKYPYIEKSILKLKEVHVRIGDLFNLDGTCKLEFEIKEKEQNNLKQNENNN